MTKKQCFKCKTKLGTFDGKNKVGNKLYCDKCFDKIEARTERKAERKTKRIKQREIKEDRIRCPKCGSKQVHVDKKGYSAKKGCCGALLVGPFGLLCGALGANKLRKTCLKCNHSWK